MSGRRQNNQLRLAFGEEGRSEAPMAPGEGSETPTAKRRIESPANDEQLMEEVCERENCLQAFKRVKSNKGSPGIDGHSHRSPAERAIVLDRPCRVHQAPLPTLAGLLQQKGDLLKPRMKITAYNHHARLLSSRASWSFSRNQFTQVEGADAVMQSSIAVLSR
jgi:hypothetical protein